MFCCINVQPPVKIDATTLPLPRFQIIASKTTASRSRCKFVTGGDLPEMTRSLWNERISEVSLSSFDFQILINVFSEIETSAEQSFFMSLFGLWQSNVKDKNIFERVNKNITISKF